MGHVTCHVTFSVKKPLFEKLVAAFRKFILQKLVLDAGQLFLSSLVCNDRPSFHRKILQGKRSFFQQNSTFDHLYLLKTKARKIIPDVARQIISVCIENAHLLINRLKIRHQFANLPNFNKMITVHAAQSKQYVKARQGVEFIIREKLNLV